MWDRAFVQHFDLFWWFCCFSASSSDDDGDVDVWCMTNKYDENYDQVGWVSKHEKVMRIMLIIIIMMSMWLWCWWRLGEWWLWCDPVRSVRAWAWGGHRIQGGAVLNRPPTVFRYHHIIMMIWWWYGDVVKRWKMKAPTHSIPIIL